MKLSNMQKLIFKDLKVVEKPNKKFVFITLIDPIEFDKVTFFANPDIKTDAIQNDEVDCIFDVSEYGGKPSLTLMEMYKK